MTEKKRVERIYRQIDKIASKGKDAATEFYTYINDCMENSEFDDYCQCLYIYYEIEIFNTDMISKRSEHWSKILLLTNLSISKKIKKLYDKRGIYQVGFDIYTSDNNILLGTIKEIDASTDEKRYLLKNREYAKITGTKKDYLEVTKEGSEAVIISANNIKLSSDDNLYNRYILAVNLLLT